jgi:ribose transport system substrate-binding protein
MSATERARRVALTAGGGLLLAGLLAACSSTSTTSSSAAAPSTATSGLHLSEVKAQLTAAMKPLPFVAPGPAFDASKAAGKTVFNMPSDTADPFYTPITQAMQQAATAAHLKLETYANQGTTSEWIQGMDQAIAQHVGAIVLGGIDPYSIEPQIKQAEAAGIVVEESHEYQEGAKVPSFVDGYSDGAFAQAAQLMADYAIEQTNGHANVLIITDNEYPNSITMYNSMVKTFKDECGSGCTYTSVNEPITNWASGIQPAVESALTSDPGLNWILPVYDSMSEYVIPGVLAKGDASKVSVASYNGTPFVLKYIEDPSSDSGIVKMDAGENTALIGWEAIDQCLRLMTGNKPAANETTAIRIFTAANVSLTGNPPQLGQGYGPDSYIQGFEKLWGVAS